MSKLSKNYILLNTSMKNFMTDLLKQVLIFGSKALLVAVLVFIIGGILINKFTESQTQNKENMVVFGEASEEVVPDEANIIFGIEIYGNNPTEMQNSATTKINNATEKLKSIGIKEEQIKTQQFEFRNLYDYEEKSKEYKLVLNVSFQVYFKKIDQDKEIISKSINKVFESGLNKITGLHYIVSKEKELTQNLKEKAIENAKKEKEFIEKNSGVKLGKIKRIYFNSDNQYPIPIRGLGGYEMKVNDSTSNLVVPDVNINQGTQKITQKVNIEYEIE